MKRAFAYNSHKKKDKKRGVPSRGAPPYIVIIEMSRIRITCGDTSYR